MTAPCTPFFNRSGGFGITGSPSAGWTFTKTAQASASETIATWQVSDNAGYVSLSNGSSVDAAFTPTWLSVNTTTTQSWLHIAQGGTDTGTVPLCVWRARIGASTLAATRPLFQWANNTTAVAAVAATGAWTYTVLHTDSAAETLASWALDEDTSSKIEFLNGSSTNAAFNPVLRGNRTGSGAPGLEIRGRITTDSGIVPALALDGRTIVDGALVTRPILAIRNNGTEVAQFTAAGNLALTNGMSLGLRLDLKSYTVATLPAAGSAGGVIFVSDAGGNGPCIAVSNGTNWKRCDNVSTTVV